MNRVCIDASLALAWLSYGKYTESANALRQEWLAGGVALLGPPVFYADVLSVLRQQVLSKKMLSEEANEALSICLDIPIRIIDSADLNRTSWRLAGEMGLTNCYDTQYLAVAELEDCQLWTADPRWVNESPGKTSRVKWLGDHGRKAAVAPEPQRKYTTPALDDPGLWRKF